MTLIYWSVGLVAAFVGAVLILRRLNREKSVTSRLPTWWAWPAVAVGWALAILLIYTWMIKVGPWRGWGLDQELSGLQSAIGLAAFGGGFVALLFAAFELGPLLGNTTVYVRAELLTDQLRGSPEAIGDVVLLIENDGRSTIESWTLAVTCLVPLRIVGKPLEDDSLYQRGTNIESVLICRRNERLPPQGQTRIGPIRVSCDHGGLWSQPLPDGVPPVRLGSLHAEFTSAKAKEVSDIVMTLSFEEDWVPPWVSLRDQGD